MSESKKEKFERLSQSRLEKVLDAIRTLKNLSSPNYEYTEDQVLALVATLDDHIGDMMKEFGVSQKPSAPVEKSEVVAEPETPKKKRVGKSMTANQLHENGPTLDMILNDLTDGKIDDARKSLVELLGS